MVSFEYLWSLNFMQNIWKTDEPTLKKKLSLWTNTPVGLWPTFQQATIFLKKFGSFNFECFWSLNFVQNIKKTNSQSWRKCCSNGQMDKMSHFEPFARFQASNNFPKKFGFVSYGFNFKLGLNYWLYFKNEIFLERKSLFLLW